MTTRLKMLKAFKSMFCYFLVFLNVVLQKGAYSQGAIIVICMYMCCSCTVFFGSRERPGKSL